MKIGARKKYKAYLIKELESIEECIDRDTYSSLVDKLNYTEKPDELKEIGRVIESREVLEYINNIGLTELKISISEINQNDYNEYSKLWEELSSVVRHESIQYSQVKTPVIEKKYSEEDTDEFYNELFVSSDEEGIHIDKDSYNKEDEEDTDEFYNELFGSSDDEDEIGQDDESDNNSILTDWDSDEDNELDLEDMDFSEMFNGESEDTNEEWTWDNEDTGSTNEDTVSTSEWDNKELDDLFDSNDEDKGAMRSIFDDTMSNEPNFSSESEFSSVESTEDIAETKGSRVGNLQIFSDSTANKIYNRIVNTVAKAENNKGVLKNLGNKLYEITGAD